jgi:alpha-tubulin suppressor-like RCC1 family protein
MPTTALGSTRFVKQGVYSGSVAYSVDDVVYYNGKWYLCTADATAGTLPTDITKFTVWQSAFNWRGNHNNTATAYKVGDVVRYTVNYTTGSTGSGTHTRTSSQVFICILDHTSNGTTTFLPLNVTYWTPISLQSYHEGSVSLVNQNVTQSWMAQGSDPSKIVQFPGYGRVGETEAPYLKGLNHCHAMTYDRGSLITQSGQYRYWGLDTNSSQPNNFTVGPHSTTASFFFNDWFRSTSNSGAGVHSTPDNQIPRLIQVEQGYDWALLLFNNGELYHIGYGSQGQSGDRSNSSRRIARPGGTYSETALATNTSTHILRNARIKRIATSTDERNASVHHCVALDEDGNVYTWGYNAYGQLGDNSTTNRNIPVLIPKAFFNLLSGEKVVGIWAGGGEYGWTMALTEKNQLYAWGYNNYGNLGLGTTSTGVLVPTEVTTQTWTTAGVGTIRKIATCTGVSTQFQSTAILTSKGSIYVAGYNAAGQFMLGNTSQQNSFVVVTSGPGASESAEDVWITASQFASMYVTDVASKKLWACGANNVGQLGIQGTNTSYNTAQECYRSINNVETALTGVTRLTAMGGSTGGNNTSVVVCTSDGWSYAAGYNGYGQLSLGNTSTQHYGFTDGNGKESTGQRAFTMVKMPPSLAGKVTDVCFMGYSDSSSTSYTRCYWLASDGRVYEAGYNSSFSVTGTVAGDHYNVMRPVMLG